MTIKNVAAVVVLALAVAPAGGNISVAQGIVETGGERTRRVFNIGYGLTGEEEDASKARARECVWENWRRKRSAHCAITRANVEGEPTTHDFYVDRGEGGRWQVFLEVRYGCCWHDPLVGKESKTETTSTSAYRIVERVDAKSGRVVPETEVRRPHTYVLRFRENAPVKDDRDDAATLRYL
jgi:hypothetical protein